MATREPPPLITECPNCHTRFRVGESQLQIAHGRVRCGACLAVFAGVDHLLIDDQVVVPELPNETNMLESVLAELAEEDGAASRASDDGALREERRDSADGITAARAYELEALAAKRSESPEIKLLNELQAARNPSTTQETEHADDANWTSVEVDTQEFRPRGGRERGDEPDDTLEDVSEAAEMSALVVPDEAAKPRASIEDALNDEEALRWWLEDELPGEDGVIAVDDDSMVVQLSELDTVRDDEFDLQELIATPDSGSKGQLEALFRELREDAQADSVDAVDERPPQAEPSSEQALRQVVADLKADSETASVDSVNEVAAHALEPPSERLASERAATELQQAMDEVEPLVNRALASGTLAAPASEAAATERAVKADLSREPQLAAQEADRKEIVSQEHESSRVVKAKDEDVPVDVTDTEPLDPLATGRVIELVEPPPERQAEQQVDQQSWNSTTFPETPAESVADITEEMAATGKAQVADSGKALSLTSLPAAVKETLERWLNNPYALRVGIVLASVLFVGQVMFWQFDEWAKSPTLRPVYAGLCSVAGCELPLRRSVQDMQSRKLAVRSHPEKADKLLVDALIINEAQFAQPFPVIVLEFMDLNQRVVGSYTLEPSSYLDGELAGSKALMAVRTPVHIDIEIADPGPTAVNYQLQFR